MEYPNPFENLRRVTLEPYPLSITQQFDPIMEMEMEFSEFHDVVTQCMVKRLRAYLTKSTQTQSGVKYISIPSNWWEHFKKDMFPKWLIKKFQVKYKEISVHYETEIRVCPHTNIPWSKNCRTHLDFMTFQNDPRYAENNF